MNVLVSGSLAYDRIMNFRGRFSDHILPRKIHVLNVSFCVDTFRQGFGGTAGNIAYNLALLGEQPSVFSSYGNDFQPYHAWFRKHRINIRHCKRIKGVTTASAYIITDRADNQITGFFPGAMAHSMGAVPRRILQRTALAIVSPGNITDMKRLPAELKKQKVPYIFDPGQQMTILSKKDLITGITGARAIISNDYELSLLQKKTNCSIERLKKIVEIIVVTAGEKGSVILAGKKRYVIPPAKPDNSSDPTGAGDAYRAGFIKGLLAGYPLPKVGRLASLVSVYTVEQYGTQTHRFTWHDFKKRYYRNFRHRI